MKVVTYNVNGLRPRISQHGTLQKLLDSFDADLICFQETKLRRPELTSDLANAEGYESFFSCTRTSERGRSGYSGVATFCRVKSAFSSSEAPLPVAAEEGFTGVFTASSSVASGLEEFEVDELRSVDGEGRCIVTDHKHFVLFNVYGPRAVSDDTERIDFKMKFFKIMQKRWKSLLSEGRTILVIGDLNIAPTSLDRCEAGPDFENNEFRRWFRSLLVENGGAFVDVFRSKHPDRRDSYTCWSQSSGAEEFNYGSRIDHILCAGSCLHLERDHHQRDHNFVACHVSECDILTEYKRWKPGNSIRWKGGNRLKLEGSDHAPVFASLLEIPDVPQHNTPPLSARYIPMIYGIQQTLVSTLMKRQITTQIKSYEESSLSTSGKTTLESCTEKAKSLLDRCNGNPCSSSRGDEIPGNISVKETDDYNVKKKAKRNQWSQLSLNSFFQKTNQKSTDPASGNDQSKNLNLSDTPDLCELTSSESTRNREEQYTGSAEKNSVALQEWQRIQNMMQNSIPLCKGHKEPCVARVVKKQGLNFGRRFYVCSRAEGPSSNPEANCGYFKWAASKSRGK